MPEARVKTMLMGYSAFQAGGRIHVEWAFFELKGDTTFSVLRSSAPEWEFEELANPAIKANNLTFSFTDESCHRGSSYRYRVDYHSADGTPRTLFDTGEIAVPAIPMALNQNYPNPFKPPTAIPFVVPEKTPVSLSVYDVAGTLVRVLVNSPLEAGPHEAIWNGRDEAGRDVSTGIYFCRLQAGSETMSRKMVLLK